MKKLILLIMAVVGVTAGVIGFALTRFSKNMEAWEMNWDDEEANEQLS